MSPIAVPTPAHSHLSQSTRPRNHMVVPDGQGGAEAEAHSHADRTGHTDLNGHTNPAPSSSSPASIPPPGSSVSLDPELGAAPDADADADTSSGSAPSGPTPSRSPSHAAQPLAPHPRKFAENGHLLGVRGGGHAPHPDHLLSAHDRGRHAHDQDGTDSDGPEGTRTPRPKVLTPSPPRSRAGSVGGGEEEGGSSARRDNATGLGLGQRNGAASGSRETGLCGGEGAGAADLAILMRTIDFAARKHSCQRRKDLDQTPYINHPIAVANFLSSTGVIDVRVIQGAILHDTVEDTHTTVEELADHFGRDVARIVEECTDDPNIPWQARKAEQIRTAPYKSREAQQVKLADKLHNLESIRRFPPVGWGKRRIQAYFVWAKQVTDICAPSHPPLARRLQELYLTAYTNVEGEYFPCHPDACGPCTEAEKQRIDKRLKCLKAGEKPSPKPIFF